MIDREKVLHGLNSCGNDYGIPNICEVTECPYRGTGAFCVHNLAHDASMLISELLKAQDARKKEWVSYKQIGQSVKTDTWCACGDTVMQNTIQFEDGTTANTLFCTNCGLMMRIPSSDKDGKWLKENRKRTLGDLFREKHMVIMDH